MQWAKRPISQAEAAQRSVQFRVFYMTAVLKPLTMLGMRKYSAVWIRQYRIIQISAWVSVILQPAQDVLSLVTRRINRAGIRATALRIFIMVIRTSIQIIIGTLWTVSAWLVSRRIIVLGV